MPAQRRGLRVHPSPERRRPVPERLHVLGERLSNGVHRRTNHLIGRDWPGPGQTKTKEARPVEKRAPQQPRSVSFHLASNHERVLLENLAQLYAYDFSEVLDM